MITNWVITLIHIVEGRLRHEACCSVAAVTLSVAVGAVCDVGRVSSLGNLRLVTLNRCLLGVLVLVLLCPDIVVLSPLVVVSTDLAGVLLVVVLVGVDKVVGLAPPGVGVLTVGVLGPGVVIVTGLGGGALVGSLVVLASDFAAGVLLAVHAGVGVTGLLAVRGTMSTVTTVALGLGGTVALGSVGTVGLAVSVLFVLRVGSVGCLGTVGGSSLLVLVLAPSLGAPSVTILVVPLIVGLSIVGLGPCLLVGLIDFEVLISAPGIPVRAVLSVLGGRALLGGGINSALGVAVATVTVTVSVLLAPDGGGLAVLTSGSLVVVVVILSPLIIISLEPSGVLLVLVRASLHGIVRLAPPGVGVLTVSLLGPRVVIVTLSGSLIRCGSTLPLLALSSFTVTVARVVGVAVLAGGGLSTVGRGTVDVLIRAPSLGAPLIGIVVVPLIVRLGLVGLSTGVVEAGLLMEVLIATIGIPLVLGVT